VIKQAPVKGRKAVKVSFILPQDAIPGEASVVGDFNGWDPFAHVRGAALRPSSPGRQGSGRHLRASTPQFRRVEGYREQLPRLAAALERATADEPGLLDLAVTA